MISDDEKQEISSARRKFLKKSGAGLATAAVVGLPGYSQLARAAESGGDRSLIPSSRYKQPTETGWRLAQPPLTTPWTYDVSPQNDHPEYPRPQMTRPKWLNLNGVWQFAASAQKSPPVGVDLTERILVPFPVESGLSGIMRQEPRMFYRRRIAVPPSWHVRAGAGHGHAPINRLLLHFESVDYDTRVWVNGHLVGTHSGGYDRFSFDITDALNKNPAGHPIGDQELIVGVYDPTENGGQPLGKQRASAFNNPGGIFYTPTSGIWKTVWVEPVPAAHIKRLQMTPNLDDNTLRLTVEVSNPGNVQVEATAMDGSNRAGSVAGPANRELKLSIPNPKLWSPDNPFLYDLKVRLVDASGHSASSVDEVDSYFGMRSIGLKEVNGRPHMVLNGEFLFQIGPLDQGFWPDGIYTAPSDEAMKFDLIKTKALGYNMVRKHIKVEPERWYYYADRLGLLVWQDMPAMRLSQPPDDADQQEFIKELHQMIIEHRNHPSIVVWVPFNEGWGQFDTAAVTDRVKQWDPSRLADQMSGSNVCNCSKNDGDMLDLHNYVGPGPAPVPDDNRASVIGEFGGLGLLEPGHLWTTQGNHAYETETSSQQLTDRYVQLLDETQRLETRCGLSAIVYTQTTDVETEINGFYTYDRRILKLDMARMRAANQSVIAASGQATNPGQPPAGTPGLVGVGFWPFNQTSGDVAPDTSGYGHDAMLVNGPAWTDGETGNALQFNGQNQFVDTGASILDTTENYSVAAIVLLDNKNGFHTAVSQDGDQHSEFFLQYSGADDRFAFSSASVRALGRNSPQTGRWYHLVGVRDAYNSKLKLYVNGSLAGMASYCPGSPANGDTVIGRARFNGGPVDFWAGKIEKVHVYDRALSTGEVKQIYQSNI